MNRNKIFIIAGSTIVVLLITLLIFLQFIQGNVADPTTNAYYINIEHCPAMEKKEQIDNELAEILSSTELNKNSLFLVPIVTINKKDKLSTPAIGMNYIRYLINPVMYVYDNNRKEDVEVFFKSHAQSNTTYLALKTEALKFTNVEPKVSLDLENDSTQFFIDLNQKVDSDPTKKIWNSLKSLRVHLNILTKQGKIKAGTNVNVYYLCGPLSGMIDTDKDGVMDKDDKCPKDSSTIYNGCPDKDKDGIHDGEDQCPDKAGDKDCFGCKCPPPPPCPGDADDDRDGVCNRQDKCPKQFGLGNCKGCPDNDCDGILNAEDMCPNEAGDCNGCKCPDPDTDGDGIPDKDDKCPKEPGKSPDGCPMKVGVVHNNNSGTFLLNGLSNISEVEAYLEIRQRNGKLTIHPFPRSSFSCPIGDKILRKAEVLKLLKTIDEPVYMNIDVVVKDKNGREIYRKKFTQFSLLCTQNDECGFIDTKAVKSFQD
jgi:hypothetical protein